MAGHANHDANAAAWAAMISRVRARVSVAERRRAQI